MRECEEMKGDKKKGGNERRGIRDPHFREILYFLDKHLRENNLNVLCKYEHVYPCIQNQRSYT